ncbi:MAG: bifunctional UDP-N-acetylglucosamine diphosphorylase/glucosamine-1-phosphate N-acetyltransferase GlmU [Rhodospirillaceae bacterium]|nr:bifunctional UDP-N-acetylglucosamine diphosphorylase/glucosamine-1-phosphate N-acetyltransferase GlmU [Rhodospirillaceae bacterium]
MAQRDENRPAAVLLAAGRGTRMRSRLPKVMHRVAGLPLIGHVLSGLAPLGCRSEIVVVAPDMPEVAAAVAPRPTAIQPEQRGTGHAVAAALTSLEGQTGDVLVLYGDTPFIRTETLRRMLERRRASDNPAVVVLGFRPESPAEYGRLIVDGAGRLERIVEFRDASAMERTIGLCNSGVMAIDGSKLRSLIDRLDDHNAKKEFYLTDIVAIARKDNAACAVVEAAEDELLGINSRADLAVAEAVMQTRLRAAAMANGATLIDPASVFFAWDTIIGQDVVIGPNVVFGPGVSVADGVSIGAFCHIEGAAIESGCSIGPFARLRTGSKIGRDAKVGNFVEVKNSRFGEGAKANHLSYVGDTDVGAKANIGAGTITANYDGFDKHQTRIGDGASIGSNVVLRAPVEIGAGAIVAAGSVVTRNVPADALVVARGEETIKDGWATEFRARKQRGRKDRKKE